MLIIPGRRKAFKNLFTCLPSFTICKKNLWAGPIFFCSPSAWWGWGPGREGGVWRQASVAHAWLSMATHPLPGHTCHRSHMWGPWRHPVLWMGTSMLPFRCPEKGCPRSGHQRKTHIIAANINIVKLNIVFRKSQFRFYVAILSANCFPAPWSHN